jgi:neutral ceramidase
VSPSPHWLLASTLFLAAAHCGTSSAPDAADVGTDITDAAIDDLPPLDTGPPVPASTAHCTYEPTPATARAGGTVAPGAVRAGAAEAPLDMPVGSALGAYTARAKFEGSVGVVDARVAEISGQFNPSVGIETRPMARALALTAGDETVVIVKADLGAAEDQVTADVARALGPEFAGKVLFATSHSHSSFGHYVGNTALGVGFGRFRGLSYQRVVDGLVAVARQALEARVPARVGVAHDGGFDPEDRVSRDRRVENDALAGGPRKDHDLYVVRVDAMDGRPIAVLPVFGVHGTVLDANNNLASTDAPGAIERAVEETFDRPVVVMHLQGAGGDVSPSGSGGIDCTGAPSCYNFARVETVGRYARDAITAAWRRAGEAMVDSLAMEMLTRSVPLGTDWSTFTVRDGGLAYAPFQRRRVADGVIFAGDGGPIVSPIDEFNAPMGAALCGDDHDALLGSGQMPGTRGLRPYRSCIMVDAVATLLGPLVDLPLDRNAVVCSATRTTVSALRLGDFMLVTLPGEPVSLLADRVRALSPYPPERTVVVGYAQGHVGYLLTPEDWLRGGYEPSINFWGPLEGEYIAERAAEMMRLAATSEREDASRGSAGVVRVRDTQAIPPPDPSPRAGTVPTAVPAGIYVRGRVPLASPQPPRMVPRLASAHFVWIGEDPLRGTPRVTLERETSGGFVPVTRRSGRAVRDGDLLLTWTPDPLTRAGTDPRTHYWVVEWQAVVPWGTPGLDDVEDRPGVPLGRYRFHVEGSGYTLDSEAFEVVPGALAVTAERSGSTVRVGVGYEATLGWRLLDLAALSNRRVPLRRGPVDVELGLDEGATRRFSGVAVDARGSATVDAGADAARVRSVRVVDRFGNAGEASL